MTNEALKPRAKRLRAAVAEMFGVKVTHSQSLELVANEENFPNWDAASASFGRLKQNTVRGPEVTFNLNVTVHPEIAPSVRSIFGENETVMSELSRMLDSANTGGALVLIASPGFQGKSTTANALMRELALDIRSDTNTAVSLIDEVRDEEAFQAVALAMAGVKVVATIHAAQGKGFERLRYYLRRYGAGETLLERLIADGQAISIHQELVWTDPEMHEQQLQIRRAQAAAAIQAAVRCEPDIVFKPMNN